MGLVEAYCNVGQAGATHELGIEGVELKTNTCDFHVNFLRLFGLDDSKPNFDRAGRFTKLS